MSEKKITREDFLQGHVDLSMATLVDSLPVYVPPAKEANDENGKDEKV